ncbi:MAG: DNA adenine methylase [Clostridia bacterium]|nr:DNA adenine methylase [Clostridia bacterium]
MRWAGGKSWFIDHLQEIIKEKPFTSYYEPFLGGGSAYFSISIFDATAILSDANKELIDTYIAVRDNVGKVKNSLLIYGKPIDVYQHE